MRLAGQDGDDHRGGQRDRRGRRRCCSPREGRGWWSPTGAPTGGGVVAEITAAGGEAVFVPTDVSRRADNERLMDACLDRYGRLDILFCNAGINLPKLITDSSDDEMDAPVRCQRQGAGLRHALRHPDHAAAGRGGHPDHGQQDAGWCAQRDSPHLLRDEGRGGAAGEGAGAGLRHAGHPRQRALPRHH